ncbi:uL14 family ribosomal protein [Candidatus Woesearchaeota archaeon]|nr:uL14 family ribosomal protein [Candidatus Woesearchaeota archaeon]
MQAVKARVTRGLQVGSFVPTCDNSGAKEIKIFTVYNIKTTKGRRQSAAIGDLVLASVKRGRPDMKNQVVYATIVRQRKEYLRPDGMRIKFEDNAAVVLKDEKGNPKGTIFKGAIAKEAVDRWPGVAKVARIVI